MTVAERLLAVKTDIEQAALRSGRDNNSVRLLAVSKRQPDDLLLEAYAAGHRDFGENYVQELERKQALLPEDARFHLIGHLQSNKAKRAATAHLIHTLDSAKLASALNKAVVDHLGVLIQVRLGSEQSKAGVDPVRLNELVDAVQGQDKLRLLGLMTIPPPGEGTRYFEQLAQLAVDARAHSGLELPELSMGMSADYEQAIACGATWVRVGTAVFGTRNLPNQTPSA